MANDNTVDNNKMVQIMAISLALKTFKLIKYVDMLERELNPPPFLFKALRSEINK